MDVKRTKKSLKLIIMAVVMEKVTSAGEGFSTPRLVAPHVIHT